MVEQTHDRQSRQQTRSHRLVYALSLLAFVTSVAQTSSAESRVATWVYPVLGPRLSSDYGVRRHPLLKSRRHHNGIDLAAPVGAQIRAISAGTVIYADLFGSYGNFVAIRHADGLTSHYGHCQEVAVVPGQQVRPGQVIGRVGNSGASTGPHLHLELRRNGVPQDPEVVLPGISDPSH